jgi:hypothetical protein
METRTPSQNILPRLLEPKSLKMWQRLCAAYAVFETFERQKTSNQEKFAYAFEAYKRHAEILIERFKDEIPFGMTAAILCQPTLDKIGTALTGKQIWESIWESLNAYIVNTMIPTWLKVGPFNANGEVKSGVQDLDEYYLKLRQSLFDLQVNEIPALKKRLAQTGPVPVTVVSISLDEFLEYIIGLKFNALYFSKSIKECSLFSK